MCAPFVYAHNMVLAVYLSFPSGKKTGSVGVAMLRLEADQLMVRPSNRGGVPVFSASSLVQLAELIASKLEGASPLRPQFTLASPICANPFKNVPVVITTAPL